MRTRSSLLFAKPSPITEIQPIQVEKVVDGILSKTTEYKEVDVTDPSYVQHLPSAEDYTLENLLSVNAPLEVVPTEILNPSNIATTELKATSGIVDAINLESNNYNKSEK